MMAAQISECGERLSAVQLQHLDEYLTIALHAIERAQQRLGHADATAPSLADVRPELLEAYGAFRRACDGLPSTPYFRRLR